jgi:hypothetical protein
MKIRDISQFVIAGIACLWMSVSASANPLQQDPLAVPLGPRTTPNTTPQDDPTNPPVIRPGTPGRLPVAPFRPLQDRQPPSDQPVKLNSKFAGWEGANGAAAGKRIGAALRGNWIMVDENGSFNGVVVPGKGAEVANMNIFLMNMGRLVKQTTVDEDGRFKFTNVRQGPYAITGWGEKGMFTFGMNILANNADATDVLPTNSLRITAYQNQTSINTDWIKYYSPQVGFRIFGRYPEGEGANNDASLYGAIGLFNNLPVNQPATSITSHAVRRTADGRLVGRVHQFNSLNGRPVDVRTTKVLLLEDDSVVAATTADNYGTFEFEQVPDGSYGVLATGVDGVGLIGITVDGDMDVDDKAGDLIDFTMIPAETIGWLNDYATEVAYRRNLASPRRPLVDPNQAGCQACNNQANGCSQCQRQYLESACRQRGITFEQWQTMGCQGVKSGFGDGRFVKEVGKSLRKSIGRVDRFYENAFSGGDGLETLQGLNNVPQAPAPGFGFGQPLTAPAPAIPAPSIPSSTYFGQ